MLLLGSTVLGEAGHFLLLEDSLKDVIAGGDCEVSSILELTDKHVLGVRIVILFLAKAKSCF